ncbi:MAG: hypothetical protein GY803_25965 [Chloroflexi bacterium]|nr:hypothetical protein [Chloroflexota bacterium]
MPIFKTGDMWSAFDTADLFIITTNAAIKQNGALVMGRGIARQARNRFRGLDKALGQQILHTCGNKGKYGLLVSPRWPAAKLGAFQVKRHYSQPASLELIRHSTSMLCAWCADHPDAQIVLNFPGIGNGKLLRSEVLPIVQQLPDVVTIWEYASAKTVSRALPNPDWNVQVKTGKGRSDIGAHHRAINITQQLLTIGRWPDCLNSRIIIHDAYDLHRQLQLSGSGAYHAEYNVTVYPAVHDLIPGQDYEIHPLTDSFRQTHNL